MAQNNCNEYRFNRDGYDVDGYDINGFDKNIDSDTFCVLHVIDTYQSITHCAFLKKTGNEKQFNNLTPKAVHSMYNELKSKIEDAMGVVSESVTNEIMTFEQFINKDI